MASHNHATVIEANGDLLRVKGALTFATVPALAALAGTWTASDEKPIIVDLSGVSHSDSAGLALLLQWVGELRGVGKEIKYINIPDQVEDFIRSNGLAKLLID
ncbi:MAG: STAS domain-containing protein [Acidiferrobacterales bacterium]